MKHIVFSIFIFMSNLAISQEIISPLKYNPALLGNNIMHAGPRDIGVSRDTLCLPFFNDFSNLNTILDSVSTTCGDTIYHETVSAIYPDAFFWSDSNAFINNTYPIIPPTFGVATLDGLNKFGKPYNEASAYGKADYLTSKPIHLNETFVDSIYLSFYYQPGGFGDFPESGDSLILEFKNIDSVWRVVWSVSNEEGEVNQAFKNIMIPVSGTEYLYDGFQFRFRNYAALYGNNDHWNIDYVYLDDNRSFDDTLFRDVSFTAQPSSYLKHYRQMPWNQFKNHQTEETASQFSIQMINNYNTIVNTNHSYEVKEKYSGDEIVSTTSPIAVNFDPFSTTFNTYTTFTIPESTTGYNEDSLTASFKYMLDPSSDIRRINDTLIYDQAFYNYYAYDDGTAEKAYGLIGTGAKFALHFFANEPDTLKEVYIHWAYVDGNKSNLFFSLMVWEDIDTTLVSDDETVLFQADFLSPKYVDSLNGFYVYRLTDYLGNETPVVVDGDFYVGWLQTQADLLNVGFDVNNVANNQAYFNLGGVWEKSVFPGAIMIRPQVGGDYSKYVQVSESENLIQQISVYPNPTSDILFFSDAKLNGNNCIIYDIAGNKISEQMILNSHISVMNFSTGFYILQIQNKEQNTLSIAKFIKQ